MGRSGSEHVCKDEATGEALLDSKSGKPCVRAAVVLSPSQLAEEVRDALARHNSSLVFLASNAKPEEVTALEQQLSGIPVVRYEPPPSATPPARSYTAPELAVLDTLVCALADAFLGTRRSMFSWNILEERVMQGNEPTSGALMGLPRGTRRQAEGRGADAASR